MAELDLRRTRTGLQVLTEPLVCNSEPCLAVILSAAEESPVCLLITPITPTPRSFDFAQDDMGEAQDDMRGARGDTKGFYYDMKGPTGPFPLVFTHNARASSPSFRRRPESRGVDGASSGYGQGSTGVRAPSPWDPAFAGVSVFDCQGFSGGWGVVLHPRGSPASYGVQLQK